MELDQAQSLTKFTARQISATTAASEAILSPVQCGRRFRYTRGIAYDRERVVERKALS